MIVVELQGGLGNQMFQYAIGRALSLQWSSPLMFNLDFYKAAPEPGITPRRMELGIFDLQINELPAKLKEKFFNPGKINGLKRRTGLPYYKFFNEGSLEFHPEISSYKPPLYLKGFFQSEKYFATIREQLIKDFSFTKDPDLPNAPLPKKIADQNSVAVHVRRGDFTNAKNLALHGVCSVDYYRKAIGQLNQQVENPVYYFFTDDPFWVEQHVSVFTKQYQIVTENIQENSWKDMYLMTLCRHHIIANSSFSWWGAWLRQNTGGQIIAPEKWFVSNEGYWKYRDIVPESWLKLAND